MVGVSAANSGRSAILIAGFAGLTAGALAMAAGEYVSVSSQRDAERGDLAREKAELAAFPEAERAELVQIYRDRGLSAELAERVAEELSHLDPLTVHARDELAIDVGGLAKPIEAAVVSALSFVIGAALPIIVVLVSSSAWRVPLTMLAALAGLVVLGAVGARLGGASTRRGAVRVLVGGTLALLISLAIGRVTGSAL